MSGSNNLHLISVLLTLVQGFVYLKFAQAAAGQSGISLLYCCVMQEADTDDNQGMLGFDEFCTFYKMMSTRRDLYLLMLTYSNHKDYLDADDLRRFLENEQKVGLTQEKHSSLCACLSAPGVPCLSKRLGTYMWTVSSYSDFSSFALEGVNVKNSQLEASWFSPCRLGRLFPESSCPHYFFLLVGSLIVPRTIMSTVTLFILYSFRTVPSIFFSNVKRPSAKMLLLALLLS